MDENDFELLTVVDASGAQGTCTPFAEDAENVWIAFADRRALVPVDQLSRQEDGTYRLRLRLDDYLDQADDEVLVIPLADEIDDTVDEAGEEDVVIPVAAETVEIKKRVRETGKVQIHKAVREEEQEVTLPLVRETVEVERVPVNRVVDGPVAERREGDTLIIPVVEEELVVMKRLVLKEEVHIRTVRTATEKTEHITLRKEEVRVERTAAEDEEPS